MRIKDELKQEALFRATVDLVNETGFVASSVAKIAAKARVSPATIYVYYKNKEDLLVSTYLAIKLKMSEAMLENFDEKLPVRDIFFRLWQNLFRFVEACPDYFQFAEQFSNSPYSDLVNKAEVEQYFDPIMQVMRRGIEQKIIKDVHFDILTAFMLFPVYSLSNKRLCAGFVHNEENINTAFSLAWDAIKL
jgi:AcrR family transcriptional regulator